MIKSLKSGFTLAEVLTTLMVIGVVAAMTIPTLMNGTENQQAKVAAKKAASVLSQGIQLLVAQETECTGSGTNHAWTNADLATCMKNVMQGTLSDNVLTTPDGMAYTFYANTAGSGSLGDVCGSDFIGGDSYRGGGNCAVIVDTNGFSKGTKAKPTANFNNTSGFTSNPEQGKDTVAFTLSAAGVRAMAFDGEGNAYEYMYGQKPDATLGSQKAYCKKDDVKTCAATTNNSGQKYCDSAVITTADNPGNEYETGTFVDKSCGGPKTPAGEETN